MHCLTRYLFISVVSLLGMGQMIAACGQKGDLYLPEPEKQAPKRQASDADATPTPPIQTDGEPEVEQEAASSSKVPPARQE